MVPLLSIIQVLVLHTVDVITWHYENIPLTAQYLGIHT